MKKRLAVLLGVLLLAGTTTMVACGRDRASVTSPAVPRSPSHLLGLSVQVPIITRLTPLALPVQWSFVASPTGSQSSNLLTGLTIVVPKGAVSVPTLITVTAEAGAPLAYDFQPAGLHFNTPITLVQDMSITSLVNAVIGSAVTGAYYSTTTLQYNATTGTAPVNEFEPTSTNWLLMQTSVSVSHFSGYTFASCSSSDY